MGISNTCSNMCRVLRPFVSRDILLIALVLVILFVHSRIIRMQNEVVLNTVQDYVVSSVAQVHEDIRTLKQKGQEEKDPSSKGGSQLRMQMKAMRGPTLQPEGGLEFGDDHNNDDDDSMNERIGDEIRMMFHRLQAVEEGDDDEEEEEEEEEEVGKTVIEEVKDDERDVPVPAQEKEKEQEEEEEEEEEEEQGEEQMEEESAQEQQLQQVQQEQQEQLAKMKYPELKKLAHSMGLDSKGNKETLINTITSSRRN